jgi:hypothetical protein
MMSWSASIDDERRWWSRFCNLHFDIEFIGFKFQDDKECGEERDRDEECGDERTDGDGEEHGAFCNISILVFP